MIRTQIYLPEQVYKNLNKIKLQRKVSVATIIREAIEKHLESEHSSMTPALLELSKLNITGGPRDISSNMNEYLYGKKSGDNCD